MKNKRNNGLRMMCVLLMLLTLVFVGSAMAYADDENAPAAEQEVIEAPQTDAEAEKASAEAEEASAEAVQAAAHVDFIQLQLGSSNYSVSIPRSYRNGEVTIEEVQANQVAYYFSP